MEDATIADWLAEQLGCHELARPPLLSDFLINQMSAGLHSILTNSIEERTTANGLSESAARRDGATETDRLSPTVTTSTTAPTSVLPTMPAYPKCQPAFQDFLDGLKRECAVGQIRRLVC
ncbi:unnamed protein product [Protopolystoma xenopodis]|uniref:Uncharacterized protein n=1 Tax=Protopolystoma xenopodis TaxID=117903 RepID=A0A3S5AWM8_9PLAT|nr:unnamed protein product [Protopolystoma xenopodis]